MQLWCQRIAQKDNKVDLIAFDLCTDLLVSPEMTGQIFVDIQICNLFNQASCRSCCIKIVFAEYTPVCDAEILRQLLLCIMCN